jgi:isoamylase
VSLAREGHHFARDAAFFVCIQQDPVLAKIKLIAEPWDLGPDGYQLGAFPKRWSEWNDKYRDAMRRVWRGDPGMRSDFAKRLVGSSDMFASSGRGPIASINYATAHDGFTLEDLVSYSTKHNNANGEDNRDGSNENFSVNSGAEGETSDPDIRGLRLRQKRNIMATLLLSEGVPMLTAGDELGRTQKGNNNAYCQDNEISWVDWNAADLNFMEFVRSLLRLRSQFGVFRRSQFFDGDFIEGRGIKDIVWVLPDGRELGDSDWHGPDIGCLGARYADSGPTSKMRVLFLLVNPSSRPVDFALPPGSWWCLFDTADERVSPETVWDGTFAVASRSLSLLIDASPA